MGTEALSTKEQDLAARAAVTMQLLVERLRAVGHQVETVTVDRWGQQGEALKSLNGVDPFLRIFNERQGGGGWRPRYTGRLRLSFGGYGNTINLPEPKAGFDVEAVAERLVLYVTARQAERERESRRQERWKAAQAAVEMLRQEFKVHGVGCLEATDTGIKVTLAGLSHEAAQRVLMLLRDGGVGPWGGR